MSHLGEFNINFRVSVWISWKTVCKTPINSYTTQFCPLKNKAQTDVIMLDFCRAFDRFHIALYCISYIITVSKDKFSNGFPHFLEVVLKERYTISNAMDVISGVSQGTALGPLLFLIYINNLPDCISSMKKKKSYSGCLIFESSC